MTDGMLGDVCRMLYVLGDGSHAGDCATCVTDGVLGDVCRMLYVQCVG